MTMTITFADREPNTGSIVRSVLRSLAAYRARRARRIALASLLEMDAHRLDDLGITTAEIHQALSR
jgi:uncharacterized protein YjiS (DUF1127 family)